MNPVDEYFINLQSVSNCISSLYHGLMCPCKKFFKNTNASILYLPDVFIIQSCLMSLQTFIKTHKLIAKIPLIIRTLWLSKVIVWRFCSCNTVFEWHATLELRTCCFTGLSNLEIVLENTLLHWTLVGNSADQGPILT